MIRWLLFGVCLLFAAPSFGCRCAQRDLSDYFNAADHVAMGRLVSSQQLEFADSRSVVALEMELLAPPHKPVDVSGPQAGDRQRYLTSTSSASCGIAPQTGAVYLLFAWAGETDDTLSVDSCSGSRIHLPAGSSEPVGFRDVPPRFVIQQLNGLAGLDVLREIASEHPDGSDPDNEVMIGLLDLESLTHAGFARLHAQPEPDSAIVAEISGYEQVRSREVGYETPAAVVYSRASGWYRLRLADGRSGWLPPDLAGTYFAYDDLPIRRLAYLRTPWHGFVWPSPGAGLPVRAMSVPGTNAEQPVEVFESQRIGGSLWFRVGILNGSPCEGGSPTTQLSGWIPAYGLSAEPLVWFYSRGC